MLWGVAVRAGGNGNCGSFVVGRLRRCKESVILFLHIRIYVAVAVVVPQSMAQTVLAEMVWRK